MGLAGAFGDQGYSCKTCGHTTGLYSPHCPVCLNNTLSRVQNNDKAQGPGPSQTVDDSRNVSERGGSPVVTFCVVAAILASLVAAYSFFSGPQTEVVQKPVESTARPNTPRVHTLKRPKHPARVVQTSKSHNAEAISPRRAMPMKLWEVSRDAEDGE